MGPQVGDLGLIWTFHCWPDFTRADGNFADSEWRSSQPNPGPRPDALPCLLILHIQESSTYSWRGPCEGEGDVVCRFLFVARSYHSYERSVCYHHNHSGFPGKLTFPGKCHWSPATRGSDQRPLDTGLLLGGGGGGGGRRRSGYLLVCCGGCRGRGRDDGLVQVGHRAAHPDYVCVA